MIEIMAFSGNLKRSKNKVLDIVMKPIQNTLTSI